MVASKLVALQRRCWWHSKRWRPAWYLITLVSKTTLTLEVGRKTTTLKEVEWVATSLGDIMVVAVTMIEMAVTLKPTMAKLNQRKIR